MKLMLRLLLMLMAVLFFGCPGLDPFLDYRGTDLIAEKDLSDWTIVHSEAYPYINFEAVTGMGYESPVTGEAVYRLELINLFRNGDFEDSTVVNPPADWVRSDGTDTL